MKKNIFILLLISILIINFSFEYKVHAEAIAISSGLVLFIKACYALGISYIGGKAVSRLTSDSVQLYREWQEFIKNKPPEQKPPVDWEKTAFLTMLGLQLGDSFHRLVDSVKDFFNELGAKPGENYYNYTGSYYYETSESVLTVNQYYKLKPSNQLVFNIQGKVLLLTCDSSGTLIGKTNSDEKIGMGGLLLDLTETREYNLYIETVKLKYAANLLWLVPTGMKYGVKYEQYISGELQVNSGEQIGYDSSPVINYYFEPNSYQFTNNPDDIHPVYPNISNLPGGKIIKVTNPDGSTTTYYKGTPDDLYNDWIATQDPNNIFGDKSINVEETEQGLKIYDNSEEMPYPNPQPEPETETSTALGKIVALLQQIVNWNKNIFDKIGKTPEKQPEPEPEPEPQPDPLELPQKVELDFSPLEGITLTEKFPFCLPWDLKRSIDTLVQPPTPPRWEVELVTEKIVIDFEQFETLAFISRSFFSITYVVTLIIITRRFISGA